MVDGIFSSAGSSIPAHGVLLCFLQIWFPLESDGNRIGNFAVLREDGAAVTHTLMLTLPRGQNIMPLEARSRRKKNK
jgi:hypothetical protein